uniref:Uncharacterized protein n=1 Tax=Toxarium undulatum TaxID=210620 RepID=A0A1D8D9L8_9STRA|nr:hypothetical protein [Toxarium undulatum]AOS86650.1 hypothetical protein [Toxarium undulatum]
MNPEYNQNSEYIKYPLDNRKFYSEIFIIKCEVELSFFAEKILEACCNKKFFQVLETIEYSLKSNLQERDYLLQIFYSIGIAMQNNRNTNFFDIQIDDIKIQKTLNRNNINCQLIEANYLRIKLFCTVKPPKKKKEPYW